VALLTWTNDIVDSLSIRTTVAMLTWSNDNVDL
jgi:hypothetical protein